MKKLLFLNNLRWFARWPVKMIVLGFVVLAVCFPYPRILLKHVQHWRNPNALIDPDAVELRPLIDELRPKIEVDSLPPEEALKAVEKFVYEKIKYDWDWNTWGTADYMPTVAEVIEKGREDCDGRAVVAASLLQHFGFESQIVTDFAHVWVKTDKGETMGPGKSKAIEGRDGGITVNVAALARLPSATAFGLAVFPLLREIIILLTVWWLLLRTGGGTACSLAALAFMLNGLLFLRTGGESFADPIEWMQWVGIANFILSLVGLLIVAPRHAASIARKRT